MEKNSPPGLESRLVYFTALCLCLELGATAREESPAFCCAVSHLGTHPKSCGPCSLGKCCDDNQCRQCRLLPKCQEGEELYCSGTTDFRYSCRPCPSGTFSDTENGCCIPWDDCKSQGLQILQVGNRTHNVKCSQLLTTVILQPDFAVTSIFVVLTTAGVFVLLLMTCFLIVCTWTQKKEKFPWVEESESPEPPNASEFHLLEEDAYSCQMPEEKSGGKTME